MLLCNDFFAVLHGHVYDLLVVVHDHVGRAAVDSVSAIFIPLQSEDSTLRRDELHSEGGRLEDGVVSSRSHWVAFADDYWS